LVLQRDIPPGHTIFLLPLHCPVIQKNGLYIHKQDFENRSVKTHIQKDDIHPYLSWYKDRPTVKTGQEIERKSSNSRQMIFIIPPQGTGKLLLAHVPPLQASFQYRQYGWARWQKLTGTGGCCHIFLWLPAVHLLYHKQSGR
jgi:hypothetical protein